jgi:hypothetical protein
LVTRRARGRTHAKAYGSRLSTQTVAEFYRCR